MVRIEPELTRSTLDEDYWLGHCEGFRVESPSGKIGTVESVVYGKLSGRPEQLAVCYGTLRLRTKLIAVDDVAVIRPRDLRLRIRATSTTGARQQSRAARRMLHPLRG
ncbi:MAG TPA: hypothetical protein VGM80_05905 [Gaiellaceae bacterium]